MTSSLARMSALVEDGSIRVIELQAVPRSRSTALGRSLNESGTTSVFIHEPFNRANSDVDVAAEFVIQSVGPALSTTGGPVVVVTKNMAHYVSASLFRTWTEVCSAVVWCVRDPWVQVSSLVTRMANDLLFGIGSDRLAQSDLLPWHLAMVVEALENSELSTDFSRTGWRSVGAHFADWGGRRPSFLADGSLFSRLPDRFLQYLCSGLGIEFSERMINGWSQPFLNGVRLVYPDLDQSVDAWMKHASTSHGVEATDHAPLERSALPAALRDHLIEVAVPTYEMFVREFYSPEMLAQFRLDLVGDPPQ